MRTAVLGEICRPKQWRTLSKAQMAERGFPVYGANGRIGFTDSFTHEEPTILIGCRGSCGSVHVSEPRSYVNGNAMALGELDASRAELRYLYHFFRWRGFDDVTTGSAQPQIIRERLVTVLIPLPAIEEQRRIAAILDHVDALRTKRRETIVHLDTLTESIFTGMSGGSELRPLASICHRVTDGTHQSPQWSESGVPFIFISNITSGEIDLRASRFVSDDVYRELTRRCPIELGDVLYSTVGSYGIPALVRNTDRFVFQRHIAHIKPNRDVVVPEFLFAAVASTQVRRQADSVARGVAQPTVNLRDVKEFMIPVPPLETQRRFSSFLAEISSIRDAQRLQLTHHEELFHSLQGRAFSGGF